MVRPGLMQTEVAAQALGIDPGTLYRWGRLGVVQPVVSIDDQHWWNVEDARAQVRKIRDGQQGSGV